MRYRVNSFGNVFLLSQAWISSKMGCVGGVFPEFSDYEILRWNINKTFQPSSVQFQRKTANPISVTSGKSTESGESEINDGGHGKWNTMEQMENGTRWNKWKMEHDGTNGKWNTMEQMENGT